MDEKKEEQTFLDNNAEEENKKDFNLNQDSDANKESVYFRSLKFRKKFNFVSFLNGLLSDLDDRRQTRKKNSGE